MSTAFHRGMVLLQQGRNDLADREFREALSQDPDDPMAHACLSLCLSRRDEDAAALAEADEAVRTGPDLAFCHYVRGLALNSLDRHAEAQAAALEAIRLDPDDADYPGLLASIEMGRRRWSEALAAAERGLALDPENATCMNFRAMALVQLGRKAEAAATLGSALADDPENAFTHANQGWALLHRGEHVKALEHFREALRLEPDLDWARAGMVEALKARFLIYRVMLAFFLWMGRQSTRAQWVVILGFIFGRKILADLKQWYPWLSPFITPILALSFGFLLLTWISSPLFNLALRFNRFGRMALSPEQRVESSWIGGFFAVSVVALAAHLATGGAFAFLLAAFAGLMLLPLAMTFQQPRGRARLLAGLYTLAVGLAGASALVMLAVDRADGVIGAENIMNLTGAFGLGAIFSTWIPALTSGLRSR
jgi:tetratricopeptide (TPR) repeat protein